MIILCIGADTADRGGTDLVTLRCSIEFRQYPEGGGTISGKWAKKMREGRFPPFGFEWKGFELLAASLMQFLAFFDFWRTGQTDARGSISPRRVQMEGV